MQKNSGMLTSFLAIGRLRYEPYALDRDRLLKQYYHVCTAIFQQDFSKKARKSSAVAFK